jgi:hypothetical protein
MKWLAAKEDGATKSRAVMYVEKQAAWARTVDRMKQAFSEAESRLERHYSDPVQREKAFLEWKEREGKTWKKGVQDAWMDWVVNGRKMEVEHHMNIDADQRLDGEEQEVGHGPME